jgi:hypothetical protein
LRFTELAGWLLLSQEPTNWSCPELFESAPQPNIKFFNPPFLNYIDSWRKAY